VSAEDLAEAQALEAAQDRCEHCGRFHHTNECPEHECGRCDETTVRIEAP
jgi:hypothetical protein